MIARRVREAGVYCEIVPYQKAAEAFVSMKPKAVILSGGPASVLDKGAPLAPQTIFESKVPVLGICYGEQAMAQQLGGKVEGGHHREFGRAEVEVTEDSPLFEGIWKKGSRYPVWMSYGDRVTELPDGFKVLGTSENAPIAVIADETRRFYATQFHLEVVHTPQGASLISNFVHRIAHLKSDWTMRAFREKSIEKIRKQVGKSKVLCGLSGGVDFPLLRSCYMRRSGISSLACLSIMDCFDRPKPKRSLRCFAAITIFRSCMSMLVRNS